MSDTKKKPKAKPKVAPPRAAVPPKLRPMGSRPMAASPSQRDKRRSTRSAGSITATATDDGGELMLFGSIGMDYWSGDGITAIGFDEAIKSLGDVTSIRLRINSGGGDVFEATAIYNMLVKSGLEVNVEIEGVAASAATLIAMAGDTIHIAENAQFMVHRASGMAWGNADDMRQYLKLLDNADSLIRLTYSRRTGLADAQLVDLMGFDNWMTAAEAADWGFVDAIDEAKKVKPHVTQATASNAAAQRFQLDPGRLAAMAGALNSFPSATSPGDAPAKTSPAKEPKKMNAKLRAKCIAAGMSETVVGEAADKWLDDNFDKVMAPAAVAVLERVTGVSDGAGLDAVLDARAKKEKEARATFRKEVKAYIDLAFGDEGNAPANLQTQCNELQDEGIEAVRAKILEAKKTKPEDTLIIRFSDSQPRERHISAISTGVQVRGLAALAEKNLPVKDRPKDWERFSKMPLIRIAEQCLLADGLSYDRISRLSQQEIAMAAMGFRRNAGIRDDAGLHTTGSLLEITRDAMHKSLQAGYGEAPQTWRGPFRQAASVSDFKTIYRIKLSAVGNLPVWNDGLPPELAKLANEKESYAVEAYAETLSFSWKLFVNDDMDALSRGPQLLSTAAGRTVNAAVWLQLTSNPTLNDGVALFSAASGARKRANLTTGTASPTNISIAGMRSKMRLMRGLNTPEGNEGSDILNLTPNYILLPTTLEGVVTQQIQSSADPASSNPAVINLAKVWGLQPVVEPLLDAASGTAFYLTASPSVIDTIEVTFLQGQETPVAHEWLDPATMCQNFSIVQTFAAKAIDHRGMQRNDGV